MDWLVFRHVEGFERIRSFLVRRAEVDADDFPHSEAASDWVVFHAERVSDCVSCDVAHKGLTRRWRERRDCVSGVFDAALPGVSQLCVRRLRIHQFAQLCELSALLRPLECHSPSLLSEKSVIGIG